MSVWQKVMSWIRRDRVYRWIMNWFLLLTLGAALATQVWPSTTFLATAAAIVLAVGALAIYLVASDSSQQAAKGLVQHVPPQQEYHTGGEALPSRDAASKQSEDWPGYGPQLVHEAAVIGLVDDWGAALEAKNPAYLRSHLLRPTKGARTNLDQVVAALTLYGEIDAAQLRRRLLLRQRLDAALEEQTWVVLDVDKPTVRTVANFGSVKVIVMGEDATVELASEKWGDFSFPSSRQPGKATPVAGRRVTVH